MSRYLNLAPCIFVLYPPNRCPGYTKPSCSSISRIYLQHSAATSRSIPKDTVMVLTLKLSTNPGTKIALTPQRTHITAAHAISPTVIAIPSNATYGVLLSIPAILTSLLPNFPSLSFFSYDTALSYLLSGTCTYFIICVRLLWNVFILPLGGNTIMIVPAALQNS